MSFLLSSISRSASRNVLLVRHISGLAKTTSSNQSLIQLKKYENKFQAGKSDTKLIKSVFSTTAINEAAIHDHSRLWTLERVVSAALIGVIPLAFLTPNPYLDYALALSLVAHVHWGIEAIVIDYIRPRLFGPIIPKIAVGLTYLLSWLTLAGLYYFNYSDVGLTNAIMMFLKK